MSRDVNTLSIALTAFCLAIGRFEPPCSCNMPREKTAARANRPTDITPIENNVSISMNRCCLRPCRFRVSNRRVLCRSIVVTDHSSHSLPFQVYPRTRPVPPKMFTGRCVFGTPWMARYTVPLTGAPVASTHLPSDRKRVV